ncbi:MAG TPA: hypothetical protein VG167_18530 [Verrucomicrobiae bacterium]|nr:hypothetical protein [Verrucomicrobiae bacterium]
MKAFSAALLLAGLVLTGCFVGWLATSKPTAPHRQSEHVSQPPSQPEEPSDAPSPPTGEPAAFHPYKPGSGPAPARAPARPMMGTATQPPLDEYGDPARDWYGPGPDGNTNQTWHYFTLAPVPTNWHGNEFKATPNAAAHRPPSQP